MREFKRFEGEVGVFVVGAFDDVELEADGGQAVADLGGLAGERVLVNLVLQAKVEESVLLCDEERDLAFQLTTLGFGLGLLVLGLRGKDRPEPVTDGFVLDFHAVEGFQHLPLDFRLWDAHPRVTLRQVAAAAVVDVRLFAHLGALDDPLAGDGTAAVAAVHELARVGEVDGVVDVPTQERLDAVPRGAIHKRLVLAGVVVPLEGDLADVAAIPQNGVDRRPRELRRARAVDRSFTTQTLDEAVDGHTLVGVEMEHAADVRGGKGIDSDRAAAIGADVAIAVGCSADEPAILDAAGEPLADVDRKLLGVEARHVGEGPSHHATSGVPLGRLRDGDEGHAVLGFEAFKLDKVEEVAGSPIHLVADEAVELLGVLLGVGDEFLEGGALVGLRRRLRDAEELDDLAAHPRCIRAQSILLHREREAFAFLLTTADSGERDEPLHGQSSRGGGTGRRARKSRPTFKRIVMASSMERSSE